MTMTARLRRFIKKAVKIFKPAWDSTRTKGGARRSKLERRLRNIGMGL